MNNESTYEAEQHVIGSILMDGQSLDKVIEILNAEDFFDLAHKQIYSAMLQMHASEMAIDVFTVHERRKDLELGYLIGLAKNTPTSANIQSYAKLVKNKAISKKLISASTNIIEIVNSDMDLSDKIDKAQSMIMDIDAESVDSCPKLISTYLHSVVSNLEKRYNSDGEIIGLPTGFTSLDNITCGLQKGDLIILAGRPSMGKTTLATNIARYAAMNGEYSLLFSLEMPTLQVIDRELCAMGDIDFNRMRSGKLLEEDWDKYSDATSRAQASKMFIDDSCGLTVNQIRARSRQVHLKNKLSLIVVDYLQLIDEKGENQTIRIQNISRGLKKLAKELNVPIIVISQLNRSLEQRVDRRPRMSDIRDSGAIEQDADLILFVYRDEVYNEHSEHLGLAEIIVAKQRNGNIGKLFLSFEGRFCRFSDFHGHVPQIAPSVKQRGFNAG